MTPAFFALARLAFLALLWFFIFTIVMVVRSDIRASHPGKNLQLRRKKKPAAVAASLPVSTATPLQADNAPPSTQQAHQGTAHASVVDPRLVVTEGSLAGTSLPLHRSGLMIGRSPDSALVLADSYSSSRHARIFQARGEWWIEDLDSTNGTFVNGQRISSPTVIRPGVAIVVGRTRMELQA